ncbi:cytochrome P450 [Pseudomaricurvus alcaniphilus]|nr:cytochrome P450 [Pseudomaricurvus alcaniphilus]
MMSPGDVLAGLPDHVPSELACEFDIWAEISAAGIGAHQRAAQFHQQLPPIFYVPRLGYLPGAWVPQKAEDLRRILQDTDTFSSQNTMPFAQMLGEHWRLIPLEMDPPEHTKYRALINTLLSPKKVAAIDDSISQHASNLINALVANKRCNFNQAFADQFPTLIFLRLMGWPESEAPRFVKWTHTLVKSQDMQEVVGAVVQIKSYLQQKIEQSRINPVDDFTGYLLASEIDGRPLTDDELLGFCFLVFIGGLDTVASSLGFHFMHLALHPEQQADLRANPDKIPLAVEELLRAYSIVNMRRIVTRDVEVGGVRMKAGDVVLISTELGNLDPDAFARPAEVDFEREDITKPHMAFSYGPHRCVGSHLARRELRIALQLWLEKVPMFRLADDCQPIMRASGVFGMDNLVFEWE